jgi:hypothetical protein
MIQTDNKDMKRIILFTIFLFLQASLVQAQYLENRFSVYFNFHNSFPGSKGFYEEGEFIVPSLYNNMGQINTYSVAGITAFKSYLSLGAGISKTLYSKWHYTGQNLYNGAKFNETAFYPVIQMHFPWKEKGLFNRLRPNIQLSPLLGLAKLSLQESPFDIQTTLNPDSPQLMSSSDLFYGLKGAVGIEMLLHQNIGLTACYGIKKMWVSSILYNDQQVFQSNVSLGLFLRIMNDKRFYY